MKPMRQRRGTHGSLGLQRVQGRELGLPGGEEGGVSLEVTGGGVGPMMSGEGERLQLRENEGWEERSYRSNKLMGEKAHGWGYREVSWDFL